MRKTNHSQTFLRKRKFLIVLPLIVIPFLTMAFWAFGGGKTTSSSSSKSQKQTLGLNVNLPASGDKDNSFTDKLSFYEKADKDSAKLKKEISDDPYYNLSKTLNDGEEQNDFSLKHRAQPSSVKYGSNSSAVSLETLSGNNDPNEEKVMRKLKLLNDAINKPAPKVRAGYDRPTVNHEDNQFSASVDKLENMMQVMNKGEDGEDPEMKKLEGVLDKILDIQHPEKIKEKTPASSSEKEKVLPVEVKDEYSSVSLLQSCDSLLPVIIKTTGFFGLDGKVNQTTASNAVAAVVHETQTLVNGSTVKLRLLQDITVNKTIIPNGSFVYGTASLKNERLEIEINSILYGNSLFPVKLETYDLDGVEGLFIPGSIDRNVAKQSADNAVQNIGISSLNPTITEQAAAAGIDAAKTLFSKKIKLMKV